MTHSISLIKHWENTITIEIPEYSNFIPVTEYLKTIETLYDANPVPSLTIIIADKESLSSVAYGFMMSLSKFSIKKGITLKLVCNERKILELIEILKIGQLFSIYPTLEESTTD
ncbi:MAG TPA: hypothetical protein PK079_13720 [Leptospiraceae bacterium]|nr:hypothetical protein [Leptospiraceae bacterium]HMW07531.1 hypothetical protein [Leptospiraceae bacterium]HMX33291.1 hypothetical protein [Leptospiraceae bacterium]HMY33168.1 hypothetical protein [Leptospiraceae bacterium]HMZ66791.1 hypothetical protein [Leptospiraceae bacterium]